MYVDKKERYSPDSFLHETTFNFLDTAPESKFFKTHRYQMYV
ncbi:hypothetical protein [Escherichia coli Nissle 1917]|nr:hypothetical protein [Escherichia coli Nissle 1917]